MMIQLDMRSHVILCVMPGRVPGIHEFTRVKDVYGLDKPGHDDPVKYASK